MPKEHYYKVWIGRLSYDVKAKNTTEAKREAAHQHRTRRKLWRIPIAEIMKEAEARRR